MEILVHTRDRFRMSCDDRDNFIDVSGIEFEQGLAVDGYPKFHYIEIREKEGFIRTFYLKNKTVRKDIDFGWWKDAEIVYTKNNH